LKDGVYTPLNGMDDENIVKNRLVFQWLGYGGMQEDRPGSRSDYIFSRPTRSMNHFHNPLKSWTEAGLDDYFLGHRTGHSQVLWAQSLYQDVGGSWSWQDARRYFYIALTGKSFNGIVVAEKPEDREVFFAKTFRGIGQLMHLVQDASVPEHVRNDIHIAPAYEGAVETTRTKNTETWNKWTKDPISFAPSILNIPSPSEAPVPISRIVDTDTYSKENGYDLTRTTSAEIGISEYANANFLSEDTGFTDDSDPADTHYFPHPAAADISMWSDTTNLQQYLRKTGEGEPVDHLATVGLLTYYRLKYFPQHYRMLRVGFDDKVYNEYASKLIPRAVGYSAGLLKYFFRGQIDFRQSGMSSNGGIELTIINHSDDALVEGKLELYYDAQNGDQEVRKELTLGRNEVNDLGKDMTFVTSFFAPTDFFPGKENTYTLVYRGKLGNEEGSVIGRYKTLNYYRSCMVVYHKHMRRLFFMSHDQDGNEKNFYIDLSNVIVPREDTTNWSSEDWSSWFRINYNPLALSVLEYDGKTGVLIHKDWDQGYVIKFKVTAPAEGYLDFNIGGEIMEEYLYGNAYGEATSYGNSIYGLGVKRFYKYNFDYLKEGLHSGMENSHINQGRLVLWEETPGSGDLSTLQWDFTYSVSSNTGGWYIDNSLCWATSSSPILWKANCLALDITSPWHPQYWSLAGGIVTALNNDFKGVGFRWWDWMETKGENWDEGPQYRHMYTHLNDPYNYGRVDPPPSVVVDGGGYVGRYPLPTGRLPHGGTVSRMMGAFRKAGTTDEITEHYRIDNKFYFGGLDTIPSNLMDPQTYPFGPAIKELLVARNWLGLDHVPAVQIEEQNNFIGNSTWPMIWHYYLLKGSMKLKNGQTETVYGLVSSRQTEFFTNWSTIERMWWDADGPLGDIRTLCDFGLIDVNNLNDSQ
jgi:hypothetical protein